MLLMLSIMAPQIESQIYTLTNIPKKSRYTHKTADNEILLHVTKAQRAGALSSRQGDFEAAAWPNPKVVGFLKIAAPCCRGLGVATRRVPFIGRT